jgi:hypothetical protein
MPLKIDLLAEISEIRHEISVLESLKRTDGIDILREILSYKVELLQHWEELE